MLSNFTTEELIRELQFRERVAEHILINDGLKTIEESLKHFVSGAYRENLLTVTQERETGTITISAFFLRSA